MKKEWIGESAVQFSSDAKCGLDATRVDVLPNNPLLSGKTDHHVSIGNVITVETLASGT